MGGFLDGTQPALTALAWACGAFGSVFALAAIPAAGRLLRARRGLATPELPPVTVLKPLKGLEPGLYENLETFCRQDYPRCQLILTLDSPDDPALAVATRLREAHPEVDLEIVVSKSRVGFNPKINNLSNAEPFIKHRVLLLSDSDVRAAPDLLRRMTAPLADPRVALVTAFYRSTTPSGLWERLEALSVNANFMPQALVAAALGLRFALGAAILVRREAFERAGGFPMLAANLADDFALGEEVARGGGLLEFADAVVETVPASAGALEHLRRQARWQRTIRLCHPAGYLGLFALHGFSLLTLKLAVAGPDRVTLGLLALLWAAKAGASAALGRKSGLRAASCAALIPLSEWLSFGAWVAGLGGSRVRWRGRTYPASAFRPPRRGPAAAAAPARASR